MIRRLLAPLLLLLPVACQSPAEVIPEASELRNGDAVGGVTLSIAQSSYRHGGDATVHLINNSAGEIGYNACTAARERFTGQEWIRIEPLRICTAAIFPLAAGSRTSFQEPITAEWEPGRYRIVLRVYTPSDEPRLLTTHPFDVQL